MNLYLVLNASIAVSLSVSVSACINQEQELINLVKERETLLCKMEALKMRTDSLWLEMSVYLEKELPPDISPPERKNMINIKNANLISMHKVYPGLDKDIRDKVDDAGYLDNEIAGEMKKLMDATVDLDSKIGNSMEKLEMKNTDSFRNLRTRIQELEAIPCWQ